MRVAVLQASPKLCLSKDDFIKAIDKMVGDVCEEHNPQLIVFPECMGLWMCLMESVTALGRIWSWFLPRHAEQANRIRTTINEPWGPARSYETMLGIQLSRPPSTKRVGTLAYADGDLGHITDYDILLPGAKRGRSAGVLARVAEWLFDRIPLRFMAKRMRSGEQFGVYVDAFSAAARKHMVTIQAGSIFNLTGRGVRNVAYVFGPLGTIIAHQEKVHPIPFETMIGILPASERFSVVENTFVVGHVNPIRVGIAICYDANFPNDHIMRLANHGCQFICCPSGGIVPSHAWRWDYETDLAKVTVARSRETGVMIGRSYNAGDLLPGVLMFQGRSSITAPPERTPDGTGVLSLVPEDAERKPYVLIGDI